MIVRSVEEETIWNKFQNIHMIEELLIAKVLHDYTADGENEMDLKANDVIEILDTSTEWWFGRNVITSQEGYFPEGYVSITIQTQKAREPDYVPYGQEKKQEEDRQVKLTSDFVEDEKHVRHVTSLTHCLCARRSRSPSSSCSRRLTRRSASNLKK